MSAEEQVRRNSAMQGRLREQDVARWAADFLDQLLAASSEQNRSRAKSFGGSERRELLEQFRQRTRRLLLFDYDGTLIPFAPLPGLAKPSQRLLRILGALSEARTNEVVLVTGRDRSTLEQWFRGLRIGFAAEHGGLIKRRDGDWEMLKPLAIGWKEKVLPILKTYADRVAGASVEEKEFSLVWHYRAADRVQGSAVARELTDQLLAFTANIDVQILRGSKVVEIRNAGINKGVAVQHWLDTMDCDFILALGDDSTDEDMFNVLPGWAYTIHVGAAATAARFSLHGPGEAVDLLEELLLVSEMTELGKEKNKDPKSPFELREP
jgi:trehalose 6-phosphate synthase/phosphatase